MLAQRGRPRHFDGPAPLNVIEPAIGERPCATTNTRARVGKLRQDRLEEPPRVDGRAEVAHVAREHRVELRQRAPPRRRWRSDRSSPTCGPGCGPCDRCPATTRRRSRAAAGACHLVALRLQLGKSALRGDAARRATAALGAPRPRPRQAARAAASSVSATHPAVVHERQRDGKAAENPALNTTSGRMPTIRPSARAARYTA